MDSSSSTRIDFLEIYCRFCDIKSGNMFIHGDEGYRQDSDSQKAKLSREALAQLSKLVESRVCTGLTIFDELSSLMSRLNVMVDLAEFSRFYDFVFFMCRENGQRNITVSRAVAAWKLVLAGRFPLLDKWCDFVEKNQRYNISEDTWQQVLAFSWCTHENLEGYDPEGAWPLLIDEFVEHMYRLKLLHGPSYISQTTLEFNNKIQHISGSSYENSNFHCKCGDPESQTCVFEDQLPGLESLSSLKRKLPEDILSDAANQSLLNCKRGRVITHDTVNCLEVGAQSRDECMETSGQNSPLCSSKSPCAVEGCLSKGFAGLLSTSSYVQFGRERRASFI